MGSNSKQIKRIAKEIPESSVIKRINVSSLKKSLPNINPAKLSPDFLKLAAVGEQIAKTSKFSNRFINQSPNPMEIILQYSKYGKPYLKTAETFSKTVVAHAGKLSKASAKQLKKFGNLSKDTIKKFKKEDFTNSAFVSVVRRTGKKGYETIKTITQWARKNKTLIAGPALLIWYTTDPEGCTDTIGDIFEFLAKAATDILGKSAEGVGRGVMTSLTDMWNQSISQHLIIGALLLLTILALCFRSIRRLVFLPFKIVGNKLNNNMDRKEANMGQRTRAPDKKVKQTTSQMKKEQPEPSSIKSNDQEAKGLF